MTRAGLELDDVTLAAARRGDVIEIERRERARADPIGVLDDVDGCGHGDDPLVT